MTIVPFLIFFANLTQATRFTADDDPKKSPSSKARCRDMATASASVTLRRSRSVTGEGQVSICQNNQPVGIINEWQGFGEVSS